MIAVNLIFGEKDENGKRSRQRGFWKIFFIIVAIAALYFIIYGIFYHIK